MPSSVRLALTTLAVTIVGLTTPVTAVRQQPPADRVLPDFDAREGRQPQPPSPQTEAEIQRARGNGRSQVPVHPFTGGVLVLERPGVNVPRAMAAPALRNVVASLSELLRRTLGEGVNIETVLAGGLWPAFADQNQVENALLNLAINARDAMPNSGRLTIETANVYLDEAYTRRFDDVAAGQYAMLSVTDSGTGIAPDVLEKVFEPFFTTKPVGQGSGLGLAMVHGFVKQSGGHIRIYSEVGQGTTVKIYLPRMMGEDAGVAVPAGTEPALLPLSGARSKEAVLLVEDNDGVREYATAVLTELGYTVLAARDGDEAMAVLDRAPKVDILFTDVVLPGSINGRELANRVLAKRPGLPVLYTTGYTRNAIIHHGRLDADVQLLSKPYTEQDLALKLRELLDGMHRRQDAAVPTL